MALNGEPTRRDVVGGGAVLSLAGSVGVARGQPAATATGTIREAVPRADGRTGPNPPIPGVLVSNGRDIARTDAEGRYSLPIEPGMTIVVIKPSGFAAPTDPETHVPLLSYVHEPEGTPGALGLHYPGLDPTGPLPAAVDFTLTRVEEPARFDVVLFTDPQPESTAEIEFVRDDVVAGLIGTEAAFGITAGDLMFDDLSMYHRYNRIIGRIGLTWWSVGGNHDLNYEATDARRSRETFKRIYGATYYAHEYAGALFIMLDNVDYLGADPAKPNKSGTYRGFVSADQMRFVAALLKETPPEKLVVLVMHIPLTTYIAPGDPSVTTVNAAELLGLLGDRPSVSFAGHTHTTEHHYLGAAEGYKGATPHHHHVLTAVSGSWWSGPLDHRGIACADSHDGTPNGFHILSIDGARYTTRYVPAAESSTRQMRISLETQAHGNDRETFRGVSMAQLLRSPITTDQAASTTVVVNLFDGGPKSVVSLGLDSRALLPMTRVARPDPFIQQVYGRHPETIKPWVKPIASSHLWTANLPPALGPGTYALKVTATDEYGREHRESMVLEITV